MRGPTREKMGLAMKSAVAAVVESNAKDALVATVGSTWPEPPRPVRALYICSG